MATASPKEFALSGEELSEVAALVGAALISELSEVLNERLRVIQRGVFEELRGPLDALKAMTPKLRAAVTLAGRFVQDHDSLQVKLNALDGDQTSTRFEIETEVLLLAQEFSSAFKSQVLALD